MRSEIGKSSWNRLEQRWLLLLLAGGLSLRLALSLQLPLSADEAHYALYALHLDWSYVDHPPLVGWLQAMVLPFSDAEWALRVLPNLLHLATSIGLLVLTLQLFPQQRRVAVMSVAIYELCPLMLILGIGMIPEVPLTTLAVWTTVVILRLENNPASLRIWLLAGLMMGLMGLTKYTAVLYAVGAAAYLSVRAVRWWRLWPFYAALGLALLIVSPVIYWNLENDFLSFRYQWEHGQMSSTTLSPGSFLVNQAIQVVLYSPLVYVGTWAVTLCGWKGGDKARVLSFCLNVPVLSVFAWSAAHEGHYLPHWTALPMVLSTPIVARWVDASRHKLLAGSQLALNFSAICLLAVALSGGLPLSVNQTLLRDFDGWKEAADHARQMAAQLPPEQRRILINNRWDASRIAWYARPLPTASLDRRASQYDLWYKVDEVSGILVTEEDNAIPRQCALRHIFKRASHLGDRRFFLYHCQP